MRNDVSVGMIRNNSMCSVLDDCVISTLVESAIVGKQTQPSMELTSPKLIHSWRHSSRVNSARFVTSGFTMKVSTRKYVFNNG